MSNTRRHRVEGLYHHGLISVDEVPIEVKRGWNRALYARSGGKTPNHERDKTMNRIKQEAEISDMMETNLYKTV